MVLLLPGCDVIRASAPLLTSAYADVTATPAQEAIPDVATSTAAPAGIYLTRAQNHYQAHDLNDAVADYSAALAAQPDSADAYLGRGLAYYAAGDLDRAIADFSIAYADQSERDHKVMMKAVRDGRIEVSQE